MSRALAPAAVRRLRPALDRPEPGRLQGTLREPERQPDGEVAPSLTVFLTGAECPFTCVFCDLWRHTHEAPTPPGALPAQLAAALAAEAPEARAATVLKLFNAANFFDPRAVPEADEAALLELCRDWRRVVVESHPRQVGARAESWAGELGGRLEVALGLETVDPRAQPRLGKGAGLDDYRRAADRLAAAGATVRCFVLVGVPFVPVAEQPAAVAATTAFAAGLGARQVSLIPLRGGNGALEELAASGDFVPPTLGLVEDCLVAARQAAGRAVVAVDLWDLERLADCAACFPARRERLRRASLDDVLAPPVRCPAGCAPGGGAAA